MPEPAVQQRIEVDLALITHDARRLTDLERSIGPTATAHEAPTVSRVRSIPGVGQILARVRRYDIHAIRRCPRVQACVSDGRLVTCANESAGQRDGTSGQQIGHAYLQGAFSEAAVLVLRNHPAGQQSRARLAQNQGQGQAFTVLAPQWARAVYDRLTRDLAVELDTFLPA